MLKLSGAPGIEGGKGTKSGNKRKARAGGKREKGDNMQSTRSEKEEQRAKETATPSSSS